MSIPRVMIACAAIAVTAFVLPAHASAQADGRLVSATLTPATATVGDRLTLTIVVEHGAATEVEGPGFGADYGGLEVIEVAQPVAREAGDRVQTTLTYTLTAFRTGEIVVPPLTVTLRGEDGVGAVTTDPLRLSVRSVLQPGDTSLRPLKPQLDLGGGTPNPIVPAMMMAAFAGLTALGYVLMRRAIGMRPEPSAAVPVPVEAPVATDVRARNELDAIASSGLAESDPAEYYARTAAAVRRYLSERFDFPAYAMTRTEMEEAMTRAGIDRWPAHLTANLLEQCDAAEFGGFVPAEQRLRDDLNAAYEIVATTSGQRDDGDE